VGSFGIIEMNIRKDSEVEGRCKVVQYSCLVLGECIERDVYSWAVSCD
jgi:hypothetical protein